MEIIKIVYSVTLIGLLILIFLTYFRKIITRKFTGKIIYSTELLRLKIVLLVTGFVVLGVGCFSLFSNLFSNKQNVQTYFLIMPLVLGTFLISQYLDSRSYIGLSGISIPTMPFFISKNEIVNYKIEFDTLVLIRKEKKNVEILIRHKDVKALGVVLENIYMTP